MKASNKLTGHALGLLALLVVQYVLGMFSNLYVPFPEGATDWQNWHYAEGQFLIVAHIAVGMLLLIGFIALWIRAVQIKDRDWKISAGLGFGSVILAVISGSEFISTQSELYSLVMSLLFLGAVTSVGWGLYRTLN